MKTIIITLFLFLSISLFSQDGDFNIRYNPLPIHTSSSEWIGTNKFRYESRELLLNYCLNCFSVTEKGYVVYRKYYNYDDHNIIYWDIDHFVNNIKERYPSSVEVLGFRKKEI